ncbi:hypothetical protein OBBRIDRAFT_67781 [Obba rivulosa]|uniref:Uncharacterized protein n=1 Tax=Obba rivulosa TaxID=1052685 RepID=A0A8E2APW0_9APHY|nr:hypothetical protein OBBRIDRAFT_67781 [Obba rivulosa]
MRRTAMNTTRLSSRRTRSWHRWRTKNRPPPLLDPCSHSWSSLSTRRGRLTRRGRPSSRTERKFALGSLSSAQSILHIASYSSLDVRSFISSCACVLPSNVSAVPQFVSWLTICSSLP